MYGEFRKHHPEDALRKEQGLACNNMAAASLQIRGFNEARSALHL